MKITVSGSLTLNQISELQIWLSGFFEDDLLVRCNKDNVVFYSDFEVLE
jgi:hypothetical protein